MFCRKHRSLRSEIPYHLSVKSNGLLEQLLLLYILTSI
ncbi:unnamed protein product, partial [Callosobruchus maculatus]